MNWTQFFYQKKGNALIPKHPIKIMDQIIKHEFHLTAKKIPAEHWETWSKLVGKNAVKAWGALRGLTTKRL